ncbi:AMP-binding protein [Mycobacterium sp. 1274761.0]|uniref:AMP-binding protein n=1 Tax=Mycobacterium sp. 1274761.0 TaxID=1834077 RepID=UPI00080045A1|nr:AMP-binding protein [Mycobacterium sp. 1274761.0]OBK70967.1 acyl-CoA synthetase [Mycobacterium sp. 1274761.0]
MTESLVTTGLRALFRSRLWVPPGPLVLPRFVREVARGRANLVTLMGMAAARWPDRDAMVDDDGAITYRELHSHVESLATSLQERGVGRGGAVGVLCRNGRGFVTAVFAAALTGADVVMLNTEFQKKALADALSSHEIGTVICDAEFAERASAAGVGVVDAASDAVSKGNSRPSVRSAGRIVLLTSGTTGTPKGVPRKPEIGMALGIGASILDRTGLRIGSRVAIPVPMFHGLGFGILILTIGLGGTVLTRSRFVAEAALVQASEHRAEAMAAVPVMLARILDLDDEVRARNPLSALRIVISSGARLDPTLAKRFMDAYGDIIYNAYGSSEVGIGALATPADLREAPETVGRPVVGCAVRILDDDGKVVGPEQTGRLFVGGDLTFDAYTGGEKRDVVDNMMDTGDTGYVDTEGRLFIVGRADDMIVSGGENVYPRAVENALAEHPDVADHAVIGVPDEDYGQRLAAFIVPQDGATVEEELIRKYLKGKVARFEQPRDITIVKTIPRNPAGKVLRNELEPSDRE